MVLMQSHDLSLKQPRKILEITADNQKKEIGNVRLSLDPDMVPTRIIEEETLKTEKSNVNKRPKGGSSSTGVYLPGIFKNWYHL